MAIFLWYSRKDAQSKHIEGSARRQGTEHGSVSEKVARFLRQSEHFTGGMSKGPMLRTPRIKAYRQAREHSQQAISVTLPGSKDEWRRAEKGLGAPRLHAFIKKLNTFYFYVFEEFVY